MRFHINLKSSKQGCKWWTQRCCDWRFPSLQPQSVPSSQQFGVVIARLQLLSVQRLHPKKYGYIQIDLPLSIVSYTSWKPGTLTRWCCVLFLFFIFYLSFILSSHIFNLFKVQALCIELNRLRDQARLMELDRYLLQWVLIRSVHVQIRNNVSTVSWTRWVSSESSIAKGNYFRPYWTYTPSWHCASPNAAPLLNTRDWQWLFFN